MSDDGKMSVIVNAKGDGYGVFRVSEFHKRPHLWRITDHNRYESIATFTTEAEAQAFQAWMETMVTR
jgi:hypothetical protein